MFCWFLCSCSVRGACLRCLLHALTALVRPPSPPGMAMDRMQLIDGAAAAEGELLLSHAEKDACAQNAESEHCPHKINLWTNVLYGLLLPIVLVLNGVRSKIWSALSKLCGSSTGADRRAEEEILRERHQKTFYNSDEIPAMPPSTIVASVHVPTGARMTEHHSAGKHHNSVWVFNLEQSTAVAGEDPERWQNEVASIFREQGVVRGVAAGACRTPLVKGVRPPCPPRWKENPYDHNESATQ